MSLNSHTVAFTFWFRGSQVACLSNCTSTICKVHLFKRIVAQAGSVNSIKSDSYVDL